MLRQALCISLALRHWEIRNVYLVIQFIRHRGLGRGRPFGPLAEVLLNDRPVGSVFKETGPPSHGGFDDFVPDDQQNVSRHGCVHPYQTRKNVNLSQSRSVSFGNVVHLCVPVQVIVPFSMFLLTPPAQSSTIFQGKHLGGRGGGFEMDHGFPAEMASEKHGYQDGSPKITVISR